MANIRLLLVDDHAVVRLGLVSLFGAAPHVQVVGEAGSVAEALALTRRHQPDVVLMDVRLPDGSGIEACREIRADCPGTRVVMLTSFADEDAVITAILAGASGYLLKASQPESLITAVERASEGGSLLDPAVTDTVLRWMRDVPLGPVAGPLRGLSEQERNILPLIADGKTNRQIAAALYLSEHTVKTYVSNILRKLKLTRRVEAATFMARHGLATQR